ncbi:hypothetical protein UFOVP1351_27 [uncultured Caudovirales phage]|uniref:Uncharacterized protein n=1 Tax=uncultured Caudovirales phage TaxID=2100421 RepID=A0A6J5RS88_9CAUD|nr:hypothetical protein UFOVP1351_27 [uncultured Caudovirales phage]
MTPTQLDRIEDKIDELNAWLGDIDSTLAKQEAQLEYHIKRTDLLEARVETVSRYVYMGVGIGILGGIVLKMLL